MTEPTPRRRTAPPWLKPAIEFAPLGAFLATWLLTKDLMLATAVVMVASLVAVVVAFIMERRIPWMPLMTAAIVAVFGGLTLYLADESFIKMKPSMINTLFAAILFGALLIGKSAVGVERIFPVNMPNLEKIEVNKTGKVRRARIFYQRERTGKSARIKERRH